MLQRRSNQQPRSIFHRPSYTHSILCETHDVRVYTTGDKRFLQFRGTGVAGTSPWRNNEAIVYCQGSTTSCPRSQGAVASAAECAPCPCTPYPRHPDWTTHGFGYVQLMFDSITSHDPRCKLGSGVASSVGAERFRLLQIGLGGGTFPYAAKRRCNAIVDIVEKQQDVVSVAQKFFGFDVGEGQLIVDDGLVGLRQLPHHYDAVVIDCMIQGVTPPGCKSPEFVRAIARRVKPGGHVAQWAWGADRTNLRDAYKQHFGNATINYYGGIGGVLHIWSVKPRGPLLG